MPCGDVTEKIKLTLDGDDKLASYALSKKSCGGAIGMESLILDQVRGQGVDNLLENKDFSFMNSNLSVDNIEEFLKFKHLHAIQSVIRAYLGLSPVGSKSACTIAGIKYDNESTIIEAEININLSAEKIESCDHCGPE